MNMQNGKHTTEIVCQKDFEILSVLGQGAYGKVFLVKKIKGAFLGQTFAMKTLKKSEVIKLKQVGNTMAERRILEKLNNPFVVRLMYAFQTKERLFYVLDYCPGGELFFYLQQIGRFKESATIFYAANILLAFKYLHENKIVYRDLKPENVLVDREGYLKITDFGLSKENVNGVTGYFDNDDQNQENAKNMICGTAEYMSPEMLQGLGFGRATDYWSFGCIIYEMLTGLPPFMHQNRLKLYQLIKY